MVEPGTFTKAVDLGLAGGHRYVWVTCPNCLPENNGRWSRYRKNRGLTRICSRCAIQKMTGVQGATAQSAIALRTANPDMRVSVIADRLGVTTARVCQILKAANLHRQPTYSCTGGATDPPYPHLRSAPASECTR
jgi:hypothetical protein